MALAVHIPEAKLTLFHHPLGTDAFTFDKSPTDYDEKAPNRGETTSHKNMTFIDDFDINNLKKYVHINYLPNLAIDPASLIKPIDDEFLCPVCFCVNTNPYSLPCTHTFCKTCIDQFEKDLCPLCRSPFTALNILSKTDPNNKIALLQFNCSICLEEHTIRDSCQSTYVCIFCTLPIENKHIFNHLKYDCDDSSTIIPCPACKKYCFNFHLTPHQKYFCPSRQEPCPHCKKIFSYSKLTHHLSNCKKNDTLPITCPHCKQIFPQKMYNTTHISSCPRKPPSLITRLIKYLCG